MVCAPVRRECRSVCPGTLLHGDQPAVRLVNRICSWLSTKSQFWYRACQCFTKRKNFILHALDISVILTDDLQLVIALAISGDLDINFTQLGLDCLLRVAVAVVGRAVFHGCPLTVLSPQLLVHLHFYARKS